MSDVCEFVFLAFMVDCLIDMHGKHSVEKECHTGSGSRHDQVPFHQQQPGSRS